MSLSPFTSTLDSGAHADSTTETFDIPTRGRKGLVLAIDVTAIGNGKSFVTGANPTIPKVIVAATNDTFVYNGNTYTIAPGTYGTLALLAAAIGAATSGAASPFSTVVTVSVDPNGTSLRFTSVATGVNVKVFATGATDALVSVLGITNGWTIAQTQAAGADGAYSATATLLGIDEASGKTWTILAGVAMSTVTTQILQVHPAMVAVANLVANALLPATVRLQITHTTNNSHTRTVATQLVS